MNIESNSVVTIHGATNNMGAGDSDGLFRLGDSNGGESLSGDQPESFFTNKGDFRLKGGDISLGHVEEVKGGGVVIAGGFINMGGTLTTEGANSVIGHGYFNVDDGKTFFDHNVQTMENSIFTVSSGLLRQQGATLTLAEGVQAELNGSGTWQLKGNNSNINGDGRIFLLSGLLLKTDGGISNISVPNISFVGKFGASTPSIEVESGILRLQNWVAAEDMRSRTRIWSGARIEISNGLVFTGPAVETVLPEIQGVINLAAGPVDPPTFACNTLVLGGRIRPGGTEDTGGLRIEADFEMEDTAIFSVNLGGTDAGASHDQLMIEGTALLGGQLAINLVDDFEPSVDQTFIIATATGGFTGNFDAITGPGDWSVAIDNTDLILTVEAAPTCAEDFGDNNGSVDVNELLALIAAWGFAPSHPADLNQDDTVDINDLLLLLAAWGPCA